MMFRCIVLFLVLLSCSSDDELMYWSYESQRTYEYSHFEFIEERDVVYYKLLSLDPLELETLDMPGDPWAISNAAVGFGPLSNNVYSHIGEFILLSDSTIFTIDHRDEDFQYEMEYSTHCINDLKIINPEGVQGFYRSDIRFDYTGDSQEVYTVSCVMSNLPRGIPGNPNISPEGRELSIVDWRVSNGFENESSVINRSLGLEIGDTLVAGFSRNYYTEVQ